MSEPLIPDEITCETQVFDIAFHPLASYLAVGQVSGAVDVYQIGDENYHALSITKHKSSCRGLLFSEDGQTLYSISSDKSILAIDASGKKKTHLKKAHSDAINKIVTLRENNVFATGDDSGIVKVWDDRVALSEVMSWSLHEDFVSGMAFDQESQVLISVAGDATLCAYDLRHHNNTIRSDEQESEIHCVEYIKDNRKIVCGTQEGAMLLFSAGRWGDCSDRFVGHPQSIDCVMKLDESTLLTGSSDGQIRIVSIQPNKILGVLGDHEEFPVEGIRRSCDGQFLASFSHDEVVRFYDVAALLDDADASYEQTATEVADGSASSSAAADVSDAMEEDNIDDDSGDSDDDDSDDEEDFDSNNNRGKKFLSKSQRFFADL